MIESAVKSATESLAKTQALMMHQFERALLPQLNERFASLQQQIDELKQAVAPAAQQKQEPGSGDGISPVTNCPENGFRPT
jgi:hypothetical protein